MARDQKYDDALRKCERDDAEWVTYSYTVMTRLGDPHAPHHLFGLAVKTLLETRDGELIQRLDARIGRLIREMAERRERVDAVEGRLLGTAAVDVSSPATYFASRALQSLDERGLA